MAKREVKDGPYSRWAWGARRRVGERSWEMLMEMPAPHADAWLIAHGVLPFPQSVEGVRLKQALREGGDAKNALYTFEFVDGENDEVGSGHPGIRMVHGWLGKGSADGKGLIGLRGHANTHEYPSDYILDEDDE